MLDAACEAMAEGSGAILTITGEPGIGKTRLLAEARRRAGDRVCFLEGRATSYSQGFPYWPVRDLLRDWLGIAADAPEASVRLELKAALGALPGQVDDVYPFLGPAARRPARRRGQRAAARPQPRGGADPHVRRGARRPARAGRRAADVRGDRRPAVGGQRHAGAAGGAAGADGGDAARRHPAVPRRPRRAVLAAGRARPAAVPAPLPRARAAAARHRREPRAGRARWPRPSCPASIVDLLAERAGGNPFFLEEALQDLIERGALRPARRRCLDARRRRRPGRDPDGRAGRAAGPARPALAAHARGRVRRERDRPRLRAAAAGAAAAARPGGARALRADAARPHRGGAPPARAGVPLPPRPGAGGGLRQPARAGAAQRCTGASARRWRRSTASRATRSTAPLARHFAEADEPERRGALPAGGRRRGARGLRRPRGRRVLPAGAALPAPPRRRRPPARHAVQDRARAPPGVRLREAPGSAYDAAFDCSTASAPEHARRGRRGSTCCSASPTPTRRATRTPRSPGSWSSSSSAGCCASTAT